MKYSKNCVLLAKNFDVRIFVRLLAKICAHFCAPFSQNMCTFVRFLKIFDVRIFVRLLAKICAHLSLELLNTLLESAMNGIVETLVETGHRTVRKKVKIKWLMEEHWRK